MKKSSRKLPSNASAKPSRTHIAVVPKSGGWAVRKWGSDSGSRTYNTRREAERAARDLLKPPGGGEIVVRGRDGRIRSVDTYSLGAAAFAKISAVEGITLTKEMRRDFRTLDRQGLSAAARRRWLIDKYGK